MHFINDLSFSLDLSTDSDSPDSSLPSSVAAEDPPSQFNEMAVLELIPVIIEQKRRGNVSPDEETTLKEIFGDLWIVIEEEVSRTMDEEMNPILKALLQSNNDGRLKRALVQHHQQQEEEEEDDQQRQYNEQGTGLEVEEKNDIFGNSVDRVRVTRWPKSFVEVNLSQLSPQQRLMRRAAFQIRRWFDFNSSPQMGTRGVRGGLKHNNRLNKIKRNRGSKKRGSAGRRPGQRRMRKTGGNHNKQRGGEGRLRKRQQNLRPKRHNTEIYVDDNHGYFDYEDFEDHSFDDMMTKPRTMRSSRLIFDEYDSMENDDLDAEEYED